MHSIFFREGDIFLKNTGREYLKSLRTQPVTSRHIQAASRYEDVAAQQGYGDGHLLYPAGTHGGVPLRLDGSAQLGGHHRSYCRDHLHRPQRLTDHLLHPLVQGHQTGPPGLPRIAQGDD